MGDGSLHLEHQGMARSAEARLDQQMTHTLPRRSQQREGKGGAKRRLKTTVSDVFSDSATRELKKVMPRDATKRHTLIG